MQLPEQLLKSMESVKGFDKEAFDKVHQSGEQVTSIRVNPAKRTEIKSQNSKIPWADAGFYLEQRPSFTFDPLFHAGTYYVQEASSMFLEQALKQTVDLSQSIKVLDLCASPGGKSTHIQSLISKDSLLVSNDVIRSRANVLKDNIIKWGCENVVVTNNDPKDFSKLENYFDMIVVDAPCSGSGLFRRDPVAIDEWSENNVQLCSQRQQRILADVWPALKKDGILIYSTCSYSKEEDEEIMDWMMGQLSVVSSELSVDPQWGITTVQSKKGAYGYRFWPDKLKGEGFFLACFQKKDGEAEIDIRNKKKPEQLDKREKELIEKWAKVGGKEFIKYENTVYAWPAHWLKDFNFLLEQLRVIYSGVLVGQLMRDKMVPEHALAISNLVTDEIERFELDYEQAIKYLQRKDLEVQTKNKGWQLFTFKHHPLGWANVLANRVNNYYPKEMRILKDK
ncbi:MAG: Fmu (Sun) domain protein [Chitinophagaceae bacterium]|nr:Fmu (Sun) domain protein [Chitinophagaceae bacterium]MBK7679215.1 Fmu (Sun) domain protein [Chitinophagaceae bacterium]MBK8299444.1 Fmu (Sun) domain protein [Chitinophagaceae bacterium]MBK9463494.1 Fmu (Sun) domain protein [Chitinophagaceae bacterium]MBK9659387.1 Fmu (Sun) domain protein [Chitinophagaceae bacterium]